MTEHERKLHREAMQRYRAKYPSRHKEWNRISTQRRRFNNPEHMAKVKRKSADKRTLFLDTLKRRPCADCNQIFPPCVMEFDHVHGKKLKAVSQLRHRKLAILQAEIGKCEIVCSNCHRMRTHKKSRVDEFIRQCEDSGAT